MSTGRQLAKNSILVASVLIFSTFLGIIRESTIAYKFGATLETDACLIAMIIPGLFTGFIQGSITSTFITVYSGYLTADLREEGWRMTNSVLTFLGLASALIVIICFIGTSKLVHLTAPGYKGEQLVLAVELTRILLPSIIIVSLIGILIGVNNAHNSFLAPSLIGTAANTVTIAGILTLGSVWGIHGLAAGTLLGVLAQLLIQIPSARKHGLRFRFLLDFSNPGLREMLWLVTPFCMVTVAGQINIIIDRVFASRLEEGIVSSLYFANKLTFLPQNIFVTAVGMVVFPVLTRAASRQDWAEMITGFKLSVRLLSLVLLPSAMGIFLLRYPLVKLLFEHGAFTSENTVITTGTVAYYLGALYFGGMAIMAANIFFALKRMTIAVGAGILTVIINIFLCLILINPLQHRGLALANSLSACAYLLVLIIGIYAVLRKQNIRLNPLAGLGAFLIKVLLAVAGMSLAVSLLLPAFEGWITGKFSILAEIFCTLSAAGLVYGLLVYLLGIEEARRGTVLLARKAKGMLAAIKER